MASQASDLPPVLPIPLSPCMCYGKFRNLWAHQREHGGHGYTWHEFPVFYLSVIQYIGGWRLTARPACGKGRKKLGAAGVRGGTCPPPPHLALRNGQFTFLSFLLSWELGREDLSGVPVPATKTIFCNCTCFLSCLGKWVMVSGIMSVWIYWDLA